MADPRFLRVTQGFNGWTPKLSVVSDGDRRVLKLSGWTGGQGNPPQFDLYVGEQGYVIDIADAVNISGTGIPVQYQKDGENVGLPDVGIVNFTGDVEVSYLSGTLTVNIVGGGAVQTVNSQSPDIEGNIELTTANINDGLDRRYVADADLVTLSNTSNTNTGDETKTTIETKLGYTPENIANKVQNLSTPSPIDYPSVDAVLAGLSAKQNSLVSGTNIKTVNGNNLLGSGDLTVASGTTVLSNRTTAVVLAATTDYFIESAGNHSIDASALTAGYVAQVINAYGTGDLTITFAGAVSYYDYGGNAIGSITLNRGLSIYLIKVGSNIRVYLTSQAKYTDWKLYKISGSSSGLTFDLAAITANRAITMPNKDVDLGDLPSIALSYITGSMAGTRPQCVGGSLNVFSGGTDNVAIGSTSCTLLGTSNSVINSQTTTFTASSSNCVVLGGNSVALNASTRVAAINSSFCNVYGTDNVVINTAYGDIGPSATNSAIIGGYGVSGQINYIGNTGVKNVNYLGSVSCAGTNNNVDVTLVNCRKVSIAALQKRLTALNITKLADTGTIPFPDTTFLVGTNGYLKSTVKLYAVTAADTVPVEALADNAAFPATNKRVKSYITTDTDLQSMGKVLHKVSVAIRDNALGNDVTFATRYVATAGNSVILAPTANGTTDINIGSGVAFSLTASVSGGALYLSITSTASVASTAVLLVESEYF